jgi:membrane associated rhomboid family serine protease
MWFLWIFGDNVEDRMGHFRFLVFYLLCGLGAGGVQVALQAGSAIPMVGASGAIAGVLGAYMLAFPYARVSTLLFLGLFFTVVQLPAFLLLGLWFALQFFSGLESTTLAQSGGVAWWAHVGGFGVGMLLLFVFQKPPQRRRAYVHYR